MEKPAIPNTDWKRSDANIFWSEIVPCHHIIQVYESQEDFINVLTSFVECGIKSVDSCIVVATRSHLNILNAQLSKKGFDIEFLISQNMYFPLDAEETLSKIMVNDWPDESLFTKLVHDLFKKAGQNKRRIRACGEMVAILLERGLDEATVHLENLWSKFSEQYPFCLFCAYPKSIFKENSNDSIDHICKVHSRFITGCDKESAEILFKDITRN